MQIQILLETTPDWEYSGRVYHVIKETGKLYAYQESVDCPVQVFSKPLMFYKTKRKFKQLDEYTL